MPKIKIVRVNAQELRNKAGLPEERKDCSVISVACATGLSYNHAHSILANAGRLPRSGYKTLVWDSCLQRTLKEAGCKLQKIAEYHQGIRKPTLAQVSRNLDGGKYLVKVSGHLLALVGGVVYDSSRKTLGRRVRAVWRLSPSI